MTLSSLLSKSQRFLEVNNIPTARLDTLVLLEDILKKDRAWILAHGEYEISSTKTMLLKKLLKQRSEHIPIAYVRKKVEFYSREFYVDNSVLVPRAESETMIDVLKNVCELSLKKLNLGSKNTVISIADIGCGSGALGITACLEVPNTAVTIIDIDENALKVAKTNVDLFTLNISIIQSNLLLDTKENYDILLCNLPYVPDEYSINLAASHEPRIAIYGGKDGLDIYRDLFIYLKNSQTKPLYILTEALPFQHSTLEQIALKSDYKLNKVDDFIQLFSVVK